MRAGTHASVSARAWVGVPSCTSDEVMLAPRSRMIRKSDAQIGKTPPVDHKMSAHSYGNDSAHSTGSHFNLRQSLTTCRASEGEQHASSDSAHRANPSAPFDVARSRGAGTAAPAPYALHSSAATRFPSDTSRHPTSTRHPCAASRSAVQA
jgi:hypothetical protein